MAQENAKLETTTLIIIGFILLLIVIGCLIFTVSVSILEESENPVLAVGGNDSAQIAKAKEISNYHELQLVNRSKSLSIFEQVVTKTLLPIFTSMIAAALAYIFANKALEAYKYYVDKKAGSRQN